MTSPTPKLTATEVAEQIGCSAKEFRVYLRANAIDKDPDTGRYAFTKTQATKHAKQYTAWAERRAEARAAARAAKEDEQ